MNSKFHVLLNRKKTIQSFTAVLLIIVILAGTAGVVVVKHTCDACGLSEYHTEIFSAESAHDGCNCSTQPGTGHDCHDKSMDQECCSFHSDRLALTDYTNIRVSNLSVFPLPAVITEPITQIETRVKHNPVSSVFNKHGGREIIIKTCQLLI